MPAGLARMPLLPFLLFTGMGATLWNLVLLALGYLLHEQQNWLQQHLAWVIGGAVLFAVLVLALYWLLQRSRRAHSLEEV
jgi:membrane protein DedA with SNARE-associated domain